jgi:transcriptional regulator with XRE-family HTH domain
MQSDIDIRILFVLDSLIKKRTRYKSQYKLAEKLGIGDTRISGVRKGHESFSLAAVTNVIKILNVDARFIFGQSNIPFPSNKDLIYKAVEPVETTTPNDHPMHQNTP